MYDEIYADIVQAFRRNSRPKSWYVNKDLYPQLVENIYTSRDEIHMPVYFESPTGDIIIPDNRDYGRPGVMLAGVPVYPEE
jgi:hypothetical protein